MQFSCCREAFYDDGQCPSGWTSLQASKKCYKVGTEAISLSQGETWCKEHGGTRASIHSRDENFELLRKGTLRIHDFALSHFTEPKVFQVGLANPAKNLSYHWTDGTMAGFTDWKTGSPSNYLYTCVFWSEDGSDRGRWDDYNGGWSYPICQMTAAKRPAVIPSTATTTTPTTTSTSATTSTTTTTTTTTKKKCRIFFPVTSIVLVSWLANDGWIMIVQRTHTPFFDTGGQDGSPLVSAR